MLRRTPQEFGWPAVGCALHTMTEDPSQHTDHVLRGVSVVSGEGVGSIGASALRRHYSENLPREHLGLVVSPMSGRRQHLDATHADHFQSALIATSQLECLLPSTRVSDVTNLNFFRLGSCYIRMRRCFQSSGHWGQPFLR